MTSTNSLTRLDVKYLSTFFLSGVIFAMGFVSSCSSDSPGISSGDKGAEMTFSVSGLSRASLTTSLDRFAIYGDMTLMGDDRDEHTNIFNKTEVVKTDNGWSYNGIQYWLPKHEHSFVAIYPLSVLESENTPQYSKSKLSFTYHLPLSESNLLKEEDVRDVVAATHRRLYMEEDAVTPVTLSFSHMMSMIAFTLEEENQADDSDQMFFVHSLELSGFKTSATFSVVPAQRQSSSQTDDRVIEVTGQAGVGRMLTEYDTPVNITHGVGSVSLLMLPQTLAADSEALLTVTYSETEDGPTSQVTVPLQDLVWEYGKKYSYRLQLKGSIAVIVASSINPWNVGDVGNIDLQ